MSSFRNVCVYTSAGVSPEQDRAVFLAWMRKMPERSWTRAEIHHQRGLTIVSYNPELTEDVKLHFPAIVCGQGGAMLLAAVGILSDTGFGTDRELLGNLGLCHYRRFRKRKRTAPMIKG